ncbi:hypothetical protein [Halioxenophilus sp. WMMB6]|uniref:hypothetical protein n=1 Tax=Halioxenophilus sp. WMMB6 TaxID=3073815 RepID=UPI00295EE289|nr:hypothetical protein [Halioxenophilus sp. WMMB6]
MKRVATSALCISVCYCLAGCAELKDTGRTIGHGTKEVATAIGHASRDTVKSIGHNTEKVVTQSQKSSDD